MTRRLRRWQERVNWIFSYLRKFTDVRYSDRLLHEKWESLKIKLAQYPDISEWPEEWTDEPPG